MSDVLYSKREISIEGIANIRQLGGYIGANERRIKDNLLIRSGHLSNVNEDNLKLLSENYNIKTVIDFRTEFEREHKPDKHIEGAKEFWLPIISPNEDIGKIKGTVEKMYAD